MSFPNAKDIIYIALVETKVCMKMWDKVSSLMLKNKLTYGRAAMEFLLRYN